MRMLYSGPHLTQFVKISNRLVQSLCPPMQSGIRSYNLLPVVALPSLSAIHSNWSMIFIDCYNHCL
ncbi:hypothetical protein AHF37_11770 [Paragonimus kellicotti]|nr:hypothetical protein AHF37_11770 [Paragonimus kellicotti]